jgi:cold shock CspA family protein
MASSTSSSTPLTGCVKWFNNKLNFGFVTVLSDGEHQNTDIFVHQSNIKTKRDCFRTLSTGECVQFELAKTDNDKHPIHAVNVTGFNGNSLHCETPVFRPRGRFQQQPRRNFQQRRQNGESAAPAATEAAAEPVAETVVETPKAPSTPPVRGRGAGRGRGRGAKTQ